MSLQHQSEHLSDMGRRLSMDDSSGDISGSVTVLSSRIQKVDALWLDDLFSGFRGHVIVRLGCMFIYSRDGVKGKGDKVIDLSTEFSNFIGSGNFIYCVAGFQFLLQPNKELNKSDRVSDLKIVQNIFSVMRYCKLSQQRIH